MPTGDERQTEGQDIVKQMFGKPEPTQESMGSQEGEDIAQELMKKELPQFTAEEIERRFTYHPPDAARAEKHDYVREKIADCAFKVASRIPDSREKAVVITKLEEAMFWANAALARRSTTRQPENDSDCCG